MNDNQEALNSYQRGKYKDAVNQFNDDTWKASSLYKSGDYEGALRAAGVDEEQIQKMKNRPYSQGGF